MLHKLQITTLLDSIREDRNFVLGGSNTPRIVSAFYFFMNAMLLCCCLSKILTFQRFYEVGYLFCDPVCSVVSRIESVLSFLHLLSTSTALFSCNSAFIPSLHDLFFSQYNICILKYQKILRLGCYSYCAISRWKFLNNSFQLITLLRYSLDTSTTRQQTPTLRNVGYQSPYHKANRRNIPEGRRYKLCR